MPRGRRPNLDRRISDLIAQLKDALVAREQQKIEASVSRQVESLVSGLGGTSGNGRISSRRLAGRGNRRPRSAASRATQSRKMKAYWAAKRKAGKSKGRARGRPKPAASAASAAQ